MALVEVDGWGLDVAAAGVGGEDVVHHSLLGFALCVVGWCGICLWIGFSVNMIVVRMVDTLVSDKSGLGLGDAAKYDFVCCCGRRKRRSSMFTDTPGMRRRALVGVEDGDICLVATCQEFAFVH